jgi:hypothetical protein
MRDLKLMNGRRVLLDTVNTSRIGWQRRLRKRVLNFGAVLIAALFFYGCGQETPKESGPKPPADVVAKPRGEDKAGPVSKKQADETKPGEKRVKETKTKPPEVVKPTVEAKPQPKPKPKPKPRPKPTHTEKEKARRPSEIPGLAFTEKLIELLDYELDGRFLGWRPNDIIFGRITDNVKEFQLGTLEAIRYTTVKLKETLTRFGDADAYDPHLVEAVNLLMNRADQFWFPSAESQYRAAIVELDGFLTNLKQRKTRFYYRTDNLESLIASYKDLLGSCHENLIKEHESDGSPVSHFQADNYFYYCQGVAHVMLEILETVRVDFKEQLETIDAVDLMDKIIEELERAVDCHPWLITNSPTDGILANHRYNLAAPISSALHNMSTMLRY